LSTLARDRAQTRERFIPFFSGDAIGHGRELLVILRRRVRGRDVTAQPRDELIGLVDRGAQVGDLEIERPGVDDQLLIRGGRGARRRRVA